MSDTFTDIKKAVEGNAQSKQLGTLMWWSLEGNRISHDDLTITAIEKGLPKRYLPSEIKPHSAFKRAVRHSNTKLPNGHLIRTINDDRDEFVVGVVKENRDTAGKNLSYKVLSRVTFTKATGHTSNDEDHSVVNEIYALYKQHLDHHTDDIRTMMTNFLKESGVSIRPSGGVYFIPAVYQSVLDSLCEVVKSVSSSNRTYQLRVFDTPESKQTLATVTQGSLEEEIRQIQDQLDKFVFEKAKETTLAKKLEGFEELRARAAMFASVLNFKTDEINQRIDKIKAVVQGHIVPKEPKEEKEDALPTPKAYNSEAGF